MGRGDINRGLPVIKISRERERERDIERDIERNVQTFSRKDEPQGGSMPNPCLRTYTVPFRTSSDKSKTSRNCRVPNAM